MGASNFAYKDTLYAVEIEGEHDIEDLEGNPYELMKKLDKKACATEQFIKDFGDHELVRGFSPKAIEFILDYVSDSEQSKVCTSDWKAFFADAVELDATNLVNNYIGEYNNSPCSLLELVDHLDDASDELINKIGDNTELSDAELLESVREELEASDDWIRVAANMIADDKGFHELPSGDFVAVL